VQTPRGVCCAEMRGLRIPLVGSMRSLSVEFEPFVSKLDESRNAPCAPYAHTLESVVSREVEPGEPRKAAYQ